MRASPLFFLPFAAATFAACNVYNSDLLGPGVSAGGASTSSPSTSGGGGGQGGSPTSDGTGSSVVSSGGFAGSGGTGGAGGTGGSSTTSSSTSTGNTSSTSTTSTSTSSTSSTSTSSTTSSTSTSSSSTSSSSSGGIPTTCAQANQSYGCCGTDGVVYYCSSGSLASKTCTGTYVCGWSTTYSDYSCVAPPGGTDPSGKHSITCQ